MTTYDLGSFAITMFEHFSWAERSASNLFCCYMSFVLLQEKGQSNCRNKVVVAVVAP